MASGRLRRLRESNCALARSPTADHHTIFEVALFPTSTRKKFAMLKPCAPISSRSLSSGHTASRLKQQMMLRVELAG
jgi:hypothetical protein